MIGLKDRFYKQEVSARLFDVLDQFTLEQSSHTTITPPRQTHFDCFEINIVRMFKYLDSSKGIYENIWVQ
jgi:hypothetical protein